MFKVFLFLHLLTAIFAVGPLVHAATTSARGLRQADAAATSTAARTLTIYSYASIVVVVLGMGLLNMKTPFGDHKAVGDFGDSWVWLSIIFWAAAFAVSFGGIVPALKQATTKIGAGESVDALRGRVAAYGGAVGLLYAGIVLLMVYRPGS